MKSLQSVYGIYLVVCFSFLQNVYATTIYLRDSLVLKEKLQQTWENGNWVNIEKEEYEYDISVNNTLKIKYNWKNDAWENSFKYTYTYDVSGVKIQVTTNQWDTITHEWDNLYKTEFIYDSTNGEKTEMMTQIWDTLSNDWINYRIVTYDSVPNQIIELEKEWIKTSSTWRNYYKIVYLFDVGVSLPKRRYHQQWVVWSSKWKMLSGDNFAYSGGNLVECIHDVWDSSSSQWNDTYKTEYTYDNNNNNTEWIRKLWISDQWIDNRKSSLAYDSNNNVTEETEMKYENGQWVNDLKYTYMYDIPNSIIPDNFKYKNAIKLVKIISLPNSLKIEMYVYQKQKMIMEVHDLKGKLVTQVLPSIVSGKKVFMWNYQRSGKKTGSNMYLISIKDIEKRTLYATKIIRIK